VGKLLVGECTEDTRVQKSAEWGRRKGQLRARDGLAHGVYKREREMEGEEMNVLEEGIRDGGCHSGPSMVDRVRVPHLCTKRLGSYKIPERPQRRERVITRFLEMTRHGGVGPRVFAFLLLSEGPRRSRWQQVAAHPACILLPGGSPWSMCMDARPPRFNSSAVGQEKVL
jgi:hypothetical protein